jgi:glutamine amidotransferase
MLKRLDLPARLIQCPAELKGASRLILPGVGSFDAGMSRLRQLGFCDALSEQVLDLRKPILGICLGMQLLGRRSEEGRELGLGWLSADVIRLRVDEPNAQQRLKVPHMGWNSVTPRANGKLFLDFDGEVRFYFVHSYHMVCDRTEDIAGTVEYGSSITAAVGRGNIQGVQFHPEKSHRFGMQVFRNFARC